MNDANKISYVAKHRSLKSSYRKVGLLVNLIRGKSVAFGLKQLSLSQKAPAESVLKTLKSAVANASAKGEVVDIEKWVISVAMADPAPTLHRWQPRGRGHANKVQKRRTHLTIGISPKF